MRQPVDPRANGDIMPGLEAALARRRAMDAQMGVNAPGGMQQSPLNDPAYGAVGQMDQGFGQATGMVPGPGTGGVSGQQIAAEVPNVIGQGLNNVAGVADQVPQLAQDAGQYIQHGWQPTLQDIQEALRRSQGAGQSAINGVQQVFAPSTAAEQRFPVR